LHDSPNLSPEEFRRLLAWLDPDPEIAAEKYVELHTLLSHYFQIRNWVNSEELADRTLNTAAMKPVEFFENYDGLPIKYCYRIAYYVHRTEWKKQLNHEELTDDLLRKLLVKMPERDDELESMLSSLRRCLKGLKKEEAEMIVRYYVGERTKKIQNRKELATELGISVETLRLRAQRARVKLERCIRKHLPPGALWDLGSRE
jgi:DNA-directed RNA polymerase specialized sigma24 family protein